MSETKTIRRAGDAINDCLFWLEGVLDGSSTSREEALIIITKASAYLAEAAHLLAEGM